ncbi:MAG: hydrogenase maturation nickel metallochaperone HypA [Candidatus Theseobacter exili]|nr:hydrogenase maturation nickel metallochaperone HypA [Candidatus Theseobacter exili]
MHEFSICQSLVDMALNEIKKIEPAPVRVIKVIVVIGGLRQIILEQLQFAYDVLIKDTIAEGSVLEVEYIPVCGKCKECGWEGFLEVPVMLCVECGEASVDITSGKELYLKQVEIDE